MAVRLKIGSYIIDAAETGSTSTTTGVRLLKGESLEGGRPGLRYSQDRTSAQIVFVAQVARDTTANLKTSLEALIAAVTTTVNADIVYEYTSGSELASWKTSTGRWSRITGRVEVDEHESGALVLVVLTAESAGVDAGGAGDPDGVIEPPQWDFGLEAGGRPTCVVRAIFETKNDATAWVQTLRAGTGRPPWMSSRFRFASPLYSPQQQQNAPSPVTDPYFAPCMVTVMFNALKASYAASSAFDTIVAAECDAVRTPRRAMDADSGEVPGFDVTLSGSLQFKLESDSTFDAADTTVTADSALRAAALACIAVMEADAKATHSSGWERVSDPQLTVNANTGTVYFTLDAISVAGNVLVWDEDLRITWATLAQRVRGTKGVRKFPHKLNAELRCTHRLTTETLAPIEYPTPSFLTSEKWDRDYLTPGKPIRNITASGFVTYSQTWEAQYTYLADEGGVAQDIAGFDQMAGGGR